MTSESPFDFGNATTVWNDIMELPSADSELNASAAARLMQWKKNNTMINSALMFASGVIGNLLALIVLMRSHKDNKRTIFYNIVAGLVITDLIGIVSLSPVVIAVYNNNFKWVGGHIMCQYFAFMMTFAGCATMFIVCAMSIERYMCIRHPCYYHTRLTLSHAKWFLIICFVAALIVASLPLMGVGQNVLHYPGTWCHFNYHGTKVSDRIFACLFSIAASLTILTNIVCNVTVTYTLIRICCKRRVVKGEETKLRSSRGSKRYVELQMAVLLLGIMCVFATCYGPISVRILLYQTGVIPFDKKADLLVIRLASMNQILDPWVYILLRRELLWKVINIFRWIFCLKQHDKEPEMAEMQSLRNGYSGIYKEAERDDTSCAAICWDCMCQPPTKQAYLHRLSTRGSRHENMSIRSTMSRSPVGSRSTTIVQLANGVDYKAKSLLLHPPRTQIIRGDVSAV